MAVHLLSDVDVVAISLVDKGANRRKFYLRKQEGTTEEFDLPGPARIVKTADWSTVYCVVAEPGWRENPGVGASSSLDDEWANPDEIRKAAHKFMKNGALVNKMHETLDPYGTIVENFVAQTTFPVGAELVKEGAWVVGIEPNEEGKSAIDKGEFTGISIQGSGIRKLVEKKDAPGNEGPKAKKCPKCGGTVAFDKSVCPNCGYKFPNAKPSDSGSSKKPPPFAAKKVLTKEDIEGIVSGLKKSDGTVTSVEHQENTGWLRAIGLKLGISKEEAEQLVDEQEDVVGAVSEERLTKIEEAVTKTGADVAALANRLADIAEKLASKKEEEKPPPGPTVEEVYHRLDELVKSVEGVQQDVDKLGEGNTKQTEEKHSVSKSDHPLAGLLFED